MSHARAVCSRRRRRAALAVTASALFCLAAAACGGDGPLAPGVGTGSLTASGAVSASGSGLAFFQSVASGGTSLFQIVVVPVSQTAPWQLQIVNYSGRLAAGTYKLSPLSVGGPDPTANFYSTNGATADMFSSTTGQLVITSSSSSAVSGTFTFTATNATGGTGTVTVQGSFIAQCAPGIACL